MSWQVCFGMLRNDFICAIQAHLLLMIMVLYRKYEICFFHSAPKYVTNIYLNISERSLSTKKSPSQIEKTTTKMTDNLCIFLFTSYNITRQLHFHFVFWTWKWSWFSPKVFWWLLMVRNSYLPPQKSEFGFYN